MSWLNFLNNKFYNILEKIEKQEGARNFLYQRHDYDCQITCIGMILNWKYKEIEKTFKKRLKTILKTGMKCQDIIKFLIKNGKIINKYGQTRQNFQDFTANLTKQTILLLSNPYTHFVVFQNDKILDPEEGVFELNEYKKFKKVVYFIEIDN